MNPEFIKLLKFVFDVKEYFFLITLGSYLLFYIKKNSLKILFIILFFFAGFREGLGTDFINYRTWYITNFNDNNLEFGYVILMNIFNYFNFTIYHLQFFFSFFTLLFFFLSVKKNTANYKNFFFFFLVFPYFFLNSFLLLRQYFAISLFFYSINFLFNRDKFKYIFIILVGSLFHYSCLPVGVFTFIFFKYINKISIIHLYVILFFSIIISFFDWIDNDFFKFLFLKTKYYFYFTGYNKLNINIFKLFFYVLEAFFLLYNYEKLIRYNDKNKYFIGFSIFSICISIIFAFNHLNRFMLYFKIFELIVLADLVYLNKKNKLYLFSIFSTGLFLLLTFLWNDYKTEGNYNRLAPYKNILFNR